MPRLLPRLRRLTSRTIRNPRLAITEARIRLLAFLILAKDPEAYQYVASWSYGTAPRTPLTKLFPGIQAASVRLANAFDRDIVTSVTAKELMALGAIVRHRHPERIVEIGTFNGNTTLNLAINAPDAQVTTIDLPPDWDGKPHLTIPGDRVNVTSRSEVGRQFQGLAEAQNIRQVYSDSATLDWNSLGGPFDMIFIDGCHEYEYVRHDTESALQHLAADGLVLWHDYGNFAGVSRAVDEFSDRLEIHAIQGTRIAIGFSV